MQKVMFYSRKGGVGKTFLTANLAYYLSQNYKVMIVEYDHLNNFKNYFNFTSSEFINDNTKLFYGDKTNLKLISCNEPGINESILNRHFQDCDYVFFDSSNSLNCLDNMSIDKLFLVMENESLHYKMMPKELQLLNGVSKKKDYFFQGIVLNKAKKDNKAPSIFDMLSKILNLKPSKSPSKTSKKEDFGAYIAEVSKKMKKP